MSQVPHFPSEHGGVISSACWIRLKGKQKPSESQKGQLGMMLLRHPWMETIECFFSKSKLHSKANAGCKSKDSPSMNFPPKLIFPSDPQGKKKTKDKKNKEEKEEEKTRNQSWNHLKLPIPPRLGPSAGQQAHGNEAPHPPAFYVPVLSGLVKRRKPKGAVGAGCPISRLGLHPMRPAGPIPSELAFLLLKLAERFRLASGPWSWTKRSNFFWRSQFPPCQPRRQAFTPASRKASAEAPTG